MKSVCFFCSFYVTPKAPGYIKFYLSEVKKHFSEVVFLTNEKDIHPDNLKFLQENNIPYRLYKNEGFDFGMWYKALSEYDITQFDRIGLVNDSCLLFKKLDFFFEWLENGDADYVGMSDCNSIQFHIQSYFIIINKNAIPPVMKYLQSNGIVKNIKEVIKVYEIGLCEYLINSGLKLRAYYSVGDEKYKLDPVWYRIKDLIKSGFPMIKKKIILRSFDPRWGYMILLGFDPYPGHYIKLIREAEPDISMDVMLAGLPLSKGVWGEFKFHFICIVARVYGILKKYYRKMKGNTK